MCGREAGSDCGSGAGERAAAGADGSAVGAGEGTLVSWLFSPSVPLVGLEARGRVPLGQVCGTWKGSHLGLGRGCVWREEGFGGFGRWRGGVGREGSPWTPAMSLSRVIWKAMTCLPFTVLTQDLLRSSLPRGVWGDPGFLGAEAATIPAAPRPLPLALAVSWTS